MSELLIPVAGIMCIIFVLTRTYIAMPFPLQLIVSLYRVN